MLISNKFHIECDTLLLSVGLIPENELSRKAGVAISPNTNGPIVDYHLQTSVPGIFACGNVLHVHDLVDYVSEESENCGKNVITYLRENDTSTLLSVDVQAGANLRYVIPNNCAVHKKQHFYMRAMIIADIAELEVRQNETVVCSRKLFHVRPAEMISFDLTDKESAKMVENVPVEIRLTTPNPHSRASVQASFERRGA